MSLAHRKIRLIMSLRQSGIIDTAVLSAIERVPREAFVGPTFRDQAYESRALPIGCGQTVSQPQVVALMTQALKLTRRHKVLEIGTGSGYHAAILARLARRVTTIERFRTLARAAQERFQALGIRNVSAVLGDGLQGWRAQAPFDRIVVGAACAEPPGKLIVQLTDNGILVVPIGPGDGPQRLTLFQRIGHQIDTRDLGPARFSAIIPGLAHNL